MRRLICHPHETNFETGSSIPLQFNQVRISVKAIGVNRADLLQRAGLYPPPNGYRVDVLGLECAGVVVEQCASLNGGKNWLGKRVMALVAGEAYASEVVVDSGSILPIPEHLSFIEAAAIPEAFLTAYDALWMQAKIDSGKSLLIHAIASGVGDAARQLCVANGIEVYGTTRSEHKAMQLTHESCTVFAIENATFPKNLPTVDVILDFVGAAYLEQNMRCLNVGGHLQVVGLLGGIQANLNLGVLLSKKLTIRGTTLRNRSPEDKGSLVKHFTNHMLPLFDSHQLQPTIDRVFSWKHVEHAHERMRSNLNIGKLVLEVD